MLSVIIPAYNAEHTIGLCISSLQRQTRPPDEIIVVDDGSADSTAEMAGGHGVTIIQQVNAGAAAARNTGTRASRGDLLLFTDADCAPAPDWVERMSAPFADPSVAGVKGVYRTSQTELVARFVQLEYEDRYDRMLGLEQIDFVDTYSAGYRREVLLSVDGFDESIAYVEDQELSFRLARRGHRLVFVRGAVVYHHHADNLVRYARKKCAIGYWKARVTRDHPGKMIHDSHTPQVLKAQIGLAGAGGILLAGGVVLRRARLAGLGLSCWVALGLATLPFVRKAWQKDRPVAFLSPLLLFIRAWALGLGFVAGNLRWLRAPGHGDS